MASLSMRVLLAGVCLVCAAAAQGAVLGLQYVRDMVAERGVASVDELLALLPSHYRSRYALMFASRSLQGASYRQPRVILYGPDGKFIVAFNGNSADRGFNAIEMMEFDEVSKQFVLQELAFDTAPDGSHKARFSEVNAKRCMACHGEPARPIWDTHPSWPGAYGEVYQAHPSKEEEDGFKDFAQIQPLHPRYQHLVGVDNFAYRYRYRPNAKDKYDGVQFESPNAELGTLLTALNFESIVATVTSQPEFASFEFALLASVSRSCNDISEWFPPDLKSAVAQSYQRFSERADAFSERHIRFKNERLARHGSIDRPAGRAASDEYDFLRRFRFVAEVGLQLNTSQWALTFEKSSQDFARSRLSIGKMEQSILSEVSRNDPKVDQLHLYDLQMNNDKYCSYLAKQSRATLTRSEAAQSQLAQRLREYPSAWSRGLR